VRGEGEAAPLEPSSEIVCSTGIHHKRRRDRIARSPDEEWRIMDNELMLLVTAALTALAPAATLIACRNMKRTVKARLNAPLNAPQ
jgi:hypothetical protein